jgi:hypothetical protein
MGYCFMDLRPATDGPGWEPDFPRGLVGFHLLADLPDVKWGIYEFMLRDDEAEEWTPSNPVGDELSVLIESGKGYPPALALARYDVENEFKTRRPSQEAFKDVYEASIRSRLSQQTGARYLYGGPHRQDKNRLSLG